MPVLIAELLGPPDGTVSTARRSPWATDTERPVMLNSAGLLEPVQVTVAAVAAVFFLTVMTYCLGAVPMPETDCTYMALMVEGGATDCLTASVFQMATSAPRTRSYCVLAALATEDCPFIQKASPS